MMDLVLLILNLASELISIESLNLDFVIVRGLKNLLPDGLLQIWPFSSKISPILLFDLLALGSVLISSSKSFAILTRQFTKPRNPKNSFKFQLNIWYIIYHSISQGTKMSWSPTFVNNMGLKWKHLQSENHFFPRLLNMRF